jgi:hypothetical protein
VDSLVTIAQEALVKATPQCKAAAAAEIMPSKEQWEHALEIFLQIPPKSSTAITNTMGGAVYLVDTTISSSFRQELNSVPRDASHFTAAFRLTYYVTKVLSTLDTLEILDDGQREILSSYLPIAVQLIDEDLSIEGSNGITGFVTPELLEEGLDLVSEARSLIKFTNHRNGAENGRKIDAVDPWRGQLETLEGFSPKTYRLGETYSKSILDSDSLEASKSESQWTSIAKRIRESSSPFWSISTLTTFKDSIAFTPVGTKLCNELVADMTGLKPESKAVEGESSGPEPRELV